MDGPSGAGSPEAIGGSSGVGRRTGADSRTGIGRPTAVGGPSAADRPTTVGSWNAVDHWSDTRRPADSARRAAVGHPPESGSRAASASVASASVASAFQSTSPSGSAPVPAPWERPDAPEHTHDPHEVTVQLDGAGHQLEDWLVQQAKDAPGVPDGSDGPVFVDESGRRSRRFRRLGILVGVACAVYAVVIVATLLSGNSNAPWLPVPGQEEDTPAGQVHSSPLPTDSVEPSGDTSGASPGVSAAVNDGTTPEPGASPTPAASGSTAPPGVSADPKPSTSTSVPPKPSASTTKDPVVEPSIPVSSSPDPSPSVDPSAGTSPSPLGGDTGAVADGPVEPSPLASVPGTTSTSFPESIV